jgi:hypothetical protein
MNALACTGSVEQDFIYNDSLGMLLLLSRTVTGNQFGILRALQGSILIHRARSTQIIGKGLNGCTQKRARLPASIRSPRNIKLHEPTLVQCCNKFRMPRSAFLTSAHCMLTMVTPMPCASIRTAPPSLRKVWAAHTSRTAIWMRPGSCKLCSGPHEVRRRGIWRRLFDARFSSPH